MIKRSQVRGAQEKAAQILERVGIVLSPTERGSIEVADFGLDDLEQTGLEIVTYINNKRYCAKELVLFPHQTCPQHRHPPVEADPGKQETFRCRWGKVYLYTQGKAKDAGEIKARVPRGSESYYTVFHELELNPGDQFTIPTNTLHWFQAGDEGAVISEFSSASRDEFDVFTDVRIKRMPEVFED